MFVIDITRQAEELCNSFHKSGRNYSKVGKKLATNALSNPVRSSEIGEKIVIADGFTNPKATLTSVPDVVKFYQTNFRKIV